MDMNLECGAGAAVSPNIPAAPVAMREAALPGYIVRKLFAANVQGERQTIIEACRAELDWSIANWKKITGDYRNHDARYDGPHPSEAHRMPHERAAAAVLNAWGHLHPTESRIRKIINRADGVLRAQRETAAADRYTEARRFDWARRAEGTLDDLRWHLAERRKVLPKFLAAVAAYRAARAVLTELPLAAE